MAHDLHDFVAATQRELQEEYVRIQKRAVEDPGTAGDQGEENWATLVRKWLPRYFHIVTKGRILTASGYASPQVDVLVLSPSYPSNLLDKKLYLSGGVVAAFECKITVTAADITKAVRTAAELKRNLPERSGSPYKELNAGIIYGLIAHSHSWKNQNSNPSENIEGALKKADAEIVKHPREHIDLITVSDLATWGCMKMTYLNPLNTPLIGGQFGPTGSAMSIFACSAIGNQPEGAIFSPIGAFLARIYVALSWLYPDMQSLANYFHAVNLPGSGGGTGRLWPISIYSEAIRDRVFRGEFSDGRDHQWLSVFVA